MQGVSRIVVVSFMFVRDLQATKIFKSQDKHNNNCRVCNNKKNISILTNFFTNALKLNGSVGSVICNLLTILKTNNQLWPVFLR